MKRHKEKSVRAPVGKRLHVKAISIPKPGILRIIILFENISIVNMVQPILGRDEFKNPDRDKVEYEQSNNQIPSSINHMVSQINVPSNPAYAGQAWRVKRYLMTHDA